MSNAFRRRGVVISALIVSLLGLSPSFGSEPGYTLLPGEEVLVPYDLTIADAHALSSLVRSRTYTDNVEQPAVGVIAGEAFAAWLACRSGLDAEPTPSRGMERARENVGDAVLSFAQLAQMQVWYVSPNGYDRLSPNGVPADDFFCFVEGDDRNRTVRFLTNAQAFESYLTIERRLGQVRDE